MSSYPTPSPGPTPVPVPTPTPTPSVQDVSLPDIPTNAYQLLLNLADAIDTVHNSFRASLGHLGDITSEITRTTHTVISTSQGTATDALATLWDNTKTDLHGAQDPLNSIITPRSLGGFPNGLRETLDQHKGDFQDGILAMEQIQMLQRSCPVHPPSPQQIEEWIQQVHNLTNALGNVSMAMQVMIMAIRSINGGFAAVCATGLVPGQPLPTFNKNAFAMQNTTGSSGGNKLTEAQLEDYLTSHGVDSTDAAYISMYAGDQGLNLEDIQAMVDTGLSPQQLLQWLQDGTISDWLYFDNKPGRSISDITAMFNQNVNTDTITQLLDGHANLHEISSNVTLLMEQGGTDPSQIAMRIKDLNADQVAMLKNRISQYPKINANDLMQLVDPKLEYDPNPKHAQAIPDFIGPEPKNGQIALNNSVSIADTTTRRIGIDPNTDEIVVIDDTNTGKYHGHVRTWDQLTQAMKNALVEDGLIDKKGRIILRNAQGQITGYGDKVGTP